MATERPAKRAKLDLDDDDSNSNDSSADLSLGEGDNSHGGEVELKINEEYAKRFEHNKKREELHRLQEKYNSRDTDDDSASGSADDTSSDSETEDEGDLATADVDQEIAVVLEALRNKDARIYDKQHTFFQPASLEATASTSRVKSKDKPMHLKDYHRNNLLNGHTEDDLEEEEGMLPSYDEEQSTLKKQLLDQAENGANSDEEDFLVRKPGATAAESTKSTKWEFDPEEADKDPDKFLLDFVTSRAWAASDGGGFQPLDSDDDEEDARAEDYERAYNMRFEDPSKANETLIGHSRKAAEKQSVRREEMNARQRAREKDKERKEERRRERDEEKARLRNLKIEEAHEKLKKFKIAAGMRNQALPEKDLLKFLSSGFDSDKWERDMPRIFDEQYYAENETDLVNGDEQAEEVAGKNSKKPKKPKWDDDIDIADIVPDFANGNTAEGFDLTEEDDDDDDEDGGVAVNGGDDLDGEVGANGTGKGGSKKKELAKVRAERKRDARKERRRVEELVDQQMVEEIGSASNQNRFRYRETSPTAFGLSAQDILMADDTQLNEFVGLKKLAAFREESRKAKDRKKLGKKARLRKWRKDTFGFEDGPKTSFAEFLDARRANVDPGETAMKGKIEDGIIGGSKKRRRAKKRKIKEAGLDI